jgi:hypothetical protein
MLETIFALTTDEEIEMSKMKLLAFSGLMSALAFPLVASGDDDDDEIPFAVAEVFFELNNTDGDLGIHALIDGEPWRRLTIEDHRERKILNVFVRGRLRRQGLTEIFFESAEPPFESDDPSEALSPEAFFRRFPPGTYEVEGRTLEGDELESETEITHAMPAPPEPSVNGVPMDEDCDEPVVVSPNADGEFEITWPPVVRTHPDLGDPQGELGVIEIYNYQVVVEAELEPVPSVLSVVLPPDVTAMTVPAEFLAQSDEFKYEVLARETSWNQTAVESCFEIGD